MWKEKTRKKGKSRAAPRQARLDEQRRSGHLANPDVFPPEEFAGFDDFGEDPEWRAVQQPPRPRREES
jgi:hypothetical protein